MNRFGGMLAPLLLSTCTCLSECEFLLVVHLCISTPPGMQDDDRNDVGAKPGLLDLPDKGACV